MSNKHLQIVTHTPSTDDSRAIEINGKKCRTLKGFYKEFARQLHFPVDFKYNPGAFTDILEDYEDYMNEPSDLKLVIKNADYLFADEIYRYTILEDHVKIFLRVAKHWSSDVGYDNMRKQPHTLEFNFVLNDSLSHEPEWFSDRLKQIIESQ